MIYSHLQDCNTSKIQLLYYITILYGNEIIKVLRQLKTKLHHVLKSINMALLL